MPANKILLVEDEKNFGMVLRDYLRMNNFEVELCENGETGLKAFKENKFDLCILDIMMPKKDGFTLSTEIKAINHVMPMVFLTARAMREDMIKGYKIGADDYIVKPFDSELLLLKINAILKRKDLSQQSVNTLQVFFEIGDYHFNSNLRSLQFKNENTLQLSPKESELLKLLCFYKNDVLKKEEALKRIWKEQTYFTGRSMDVYITKLRKYLSKDGAIEIKSLHGNGYTLSVK